MVRHLVFILSVALLAVAVTQFGFLHPRVETLAEKLTPAALALYDEWVPPPSLLARGGRGGALSIGGVAITALFADIPETQAAGLGGIRRIREDEGMLYVYPRPDFYTHSASGMRFPMDIIWLGDDKKIADVITDIAPETYPDYAYVNDFLAQYVLETRAGFFEKHDLKLGDAIDFSLEGKMGTK